MRVLLIEDYEPLQKSITNGLRDSGFAVDAAGDGREGLWFATSNEYDAIILDLMLPGLDGLSVLQKIRAKGRETCVLILTAKTEVPDRVKGLDLGADDYLVKPFAFEELLARLRALVRRRYQQDVSEWQIGSLRINTASQQVWRDECEITLTAREYALLEYLAMRQGEVVSRTDIWEHIYDFHSDATSNVVDVYIGYLRRKIDAPGSDSLIRTVRGRGYVFGN
ncbi:MAG: DNA-binding response regulator [Phycisphaeraceae bacterium]|nr:DNA-binding response regulator [Phycisphaeraceae bacterium]